MANEIIRGMGIAHMAVAAADFEKSLKFYASLGIKLFTVWGAEGSRIALLDVGDGSRIELFEKPDLTAGESAFLHLAFSVQNVDEAYEAALRAGAVGLRAPKDLPLDAKPFRITLRVAFVRGPAGEELEFCKQVVGRFA
jgi:catechol 2,3-dioxygenase-like lactoylglutathione lyase family enzyme